MLELVNLYVRVGKFVSVCRIVRLYFLIIVENRLSKRVSLANVTSRDR